MIWLAVIAAVAAFIAHRTGYPRFAVALAAIAGVAALIATIFVFSVAGG